MTCTNALGPARSENSTTRSSLQLCAATMLNLALVTDCWTCYDHPHHMTIIINNIIIVIKLSSIINSSKQYHHRAGRRNFRECRRGGAESVSSTRSTRSTRPVRHTCSTGRPKLHHGLPDAAVSRMELLPLMGKSCM